MNYHTKGRSKLEVIIHTHCTQVESKITERLHRHSKFPLNFCFLRNERELTFAIALLFMNANSVYFASNARAYDKALIRYMNTFDDLSFRQIKMNVLLQVGVA